MLSVLTEGGRPAPPGLSASSLLEFHPFNGFSSSPRNIIHVNVFHGTPGKVGVDLYVDCMSPSRMKHG